MQTEDRKVDWEQIKRCLALIDKSSKDFLRQTLIIGGAVVALAEKTGKPLNQLTLAELQSVDKTFGRDALGVFNLKTAMAKRNLTGAPGTKEVAKQLARWREQLS